MVIAKIKGCIKKYIPVPAVVLIGMALVCAVIHVVSCFSENFSDFFNRYISSLIRGTLAAISGVLPFSVAETLIIMIPVIFAAVIIKCTRLTNKDTTKGVRFIAMIAGVLSLLYSLFVTTTAIAYNGTTLSSKLGLEPMPVTVEELRVAAEYMIEKMDAELDYVNFTYGKGSVMPYSFSQLNRLILRAYDSACDRYAFIPRHNTRLKQIALSEPMTYTHISGIFTYYTGEANININFPDYSIPFTAAHEFAHQRGILPENEANFVAFLVCCESDDPYIRYSGYINMYEYLGSALYSADYDVFASVFIGVDARARSEMIAYNEFYEKYRDNAAADVSSAINDTYLKSQGQTAGEKSYGMVVDLAVAYVMSMNANKEAIE